MNNRPIIFIVLFSIILFTGCSNYDVDREAEQNKLMQLSRNWSDLAQTGNIDTLLTFWAEDAVMMPPGQPPLKGKEAIRSFVEASAQIPGFEISWEPVSAHLSPDGNMAYMIERNRIAFDDSLGNRVVQHNKVVTVWRKNENGSWNNVVDMWNEAPPEQ